MKKLDNLRIGVFDSGVGGISILNQILLHSSEDIVYLADTRYLPYGDQTPELLLERARIIVNFFKQQNINTIIIACHTSSATTLAIIEKEFPKITFIDMLQPTIESAIKHTRNNRVGIIATPATISSGYHKKQLLKNSPEFLVFEQSCPQLVPLIESQAPKEKLIETLETYLDPLLNNSIDTLILGCTHYAFLKKQIALIAPHLKLIAAEDSAENLFENKNSESKEIMFFVSGDTNAFKSSLTYFLKNNTNDTVTIKQFTEGRTTA